MRRFRLAVLLFFLLVPAPAAAQTPSGPLPRILLGQTGEVEPPGTLRVSLLELGLFDSVSFVPVRNLEISLAGSPILPSENSLAIPAIRYRVLALDHVHVALGAAWMQYYPFLLGDQMDFAWDQGHHPTVEAAVTGIFGDVRVNLAARYFFVADTLWQGELDKRGIDDLFLSLGADWRILHWLAVYLETSLLLPVETVDDTADAGTMAPVPLPIIAGGARFILGRWNLEAGVVNLAPWLGVSVAFNMY